MLLKSSAILLSCVLSSTVWAGAGKIQHGADLKFMKQPTPNAEKTIIPPKVQLNEPKALAELTSAEVELKWSVSTGADVYHLQVATDPVFKWLLVDDHTVQANSYQLKDLKPGTQYFWRVAPRRPGNEPSYTKGSFTKSSFSVK